jgi:oxygen-dependent protoporphyrinogen oxidase
MQPTYKEVVVIGAGLTGLTTALRLKIKNKDFVVIEKSDRVGGVIHTAVKGEFVYEEGPNTGVLGTPEVVELFEELDGKCKLVPADKNVNKRFILKNGKWELLPGGLIGGIRTPLFRFSDKLRILGEPFRKPGTDPHETLAEMVKRRMGLSFLEYAVDPFILGVYAGDPNILVTKYALPKLYNLEQNYGSFIGGTIKKAKEKKSEREKKATREVFSAEGGLSSLIFALEKSVGKENIILNCSGLKITKNGTEYLVCGNSGETEYQYRTKNIITTIPAYELPGIFDFISEAEIKPISTLFYAKTAEVILGFDTWEGISIDGFGGLIPFKENRDILGVMFLSSLFANRAPKGGALITVFVGGVRKGHLVDLSEAEIKSLVEKEVKDLMQITNFKPSLFVVWKHERAIPQYLKDSGERFEMVERLQKENHGLQIGGNLRDGIGMADRIKQAFELAQFSIDNG